MDAIKVFSSEYDFLSNFHPCRIDYNGYSYSSVEAAFQSEKCADPSMCAQFSNLSARDAKRFGRMVELRGDWEQHKVDVMRDLLRIKFLGNPELLEKLVHTGTAALIEGNTWHDNFWGDCGCDRCKDKQGQNMLGTLLMDLRNSVQAGIPLENMPASFRFMNVNVEPVKLFTKARVLWLMYHKGANSATLSMIREQYMAIFGADLVWRYPILDCFEDGCVIIPVREGFLRLPYDEQFAENVESYQGLTAELLTPDTVKTLLREMNAYIRDLQSALAEMLISLGGVMTARESPTLMLNLPDGQVLRAAISRDAEYPALRIDLENPIARMHPESLCFVEHNSDRPEGHRLCICAYTESSDDPDYYKSYVRYDDAEDKQGEEQP